MNDAQLIHYALLRQSPGAGERFSGLMGRFKFYLTFTIPYALMFW